MKFIAIFTTSFLLFFPSLIRSEPSPIVGKIITPSSSPSKPAVYQSNRDLIQNFYTAFQEVDNENLSALLAEDYRINNLSNIQDASYTKFTTMSKNLKIRAAALKKAFPDYTLQFGDFIVDGSKVVVAVTLSGTQKGPFLGIAPTNKPIHFKFIDIFTIENGKITELSQMWNELSVMKQLGYIVF